MALYANAMPVFDLIGLGRAGTAVGRALAARGWKPGQLCARRAAAARAAARAIGGGTPVTWAAYVPGQAPLTIVAVPDGAIVAIAAALARRRTNWKGATVIHLSGLLPATALEPLGRAGATLTAVHPLASIPNASGAARLIGAHYGIEGNADGLRQARRLVRALGGHPLLITAAAKPLYHAAAVFAANYPAALLAAAAALLGAAGLSRRQAQATAAALGMSCVEGFERGGAAALTGPLVRRELRTVAIHRRALARHDPHLERLYAELARATRRLIAGRASRSR